MGTTSPLGEMDDPFPLTPALSPGEREVHMAMARRWAPAYAMPTSGFINPKSLGLQGTGLRFSRSPGERAGVRGKGPSFELRREILPVASVST